jgi:hypothetical protein
MKLDTYLTGYLLMFVDLEWMRVAAATGISFRYKDSNRESWDFKWRGEFRKIVTEQVISGIIPLCTRALNIWMCCYNNLVQLWICIAKRCEI